MTSDKIKKQGGTFILNKYEPIHRWYSYIEGYSSCLISAEFQKLLTINPNIKTVYDPFCGTGTTALVASQKNILSYYSESNPFMRSVIETKINLVREACQTTTTKELRRYIDIIPFYQSEVEVYWGGFEKFFDAHQLSEILIIKDLIQKESNHLVKQFLTLALSSIIVKVSKMIRRGDLRYATEKEYQFIDVRQYFIAKLLEIIDDIDCYGEQLLQGTIKVSDDARNNEYLDEFDCVITSPPYLNGTNYIRNTKLELKLNDFISSESDMSVFHSKGIVAGINNVSKRTETTVVLPLVQQYIDALKPVAYDERIAKMVNGYFNDMDIVIRKLSCSIKCGGLFTMDIGDSQFAGVHIPTHQILADICKEYGFTLFDDEILRQRKSKNGMVLSQRLLRFRLEK